MAEKLIAKQTGNQLPAELRQKYSEVLQVENAGRIAIYGIDKKTKRRRQIGYKSLIKAFDKNPEKQKPAQGVWSGTTGERPVTVIGTYGAGDDGTEYMRVRGSKTGVPRNEIKWLGGENGSNSEDQGLKDQVAELTRRIEDMDTRLTELDRRNTELEARNKELATKNTELESQLQSYRGKYDRQQDIKVTPESNLTHSDDRMRRSWNISSGWVGKRLPWGRPPVYENAHIEDRDGEPVIVTQEEVVDGYTPYERRRGAAAIIGTIAAIGAAVLVAGLWGEHEEREGRNSVPKVLVAPSHPSTPTLTSPGSNLGHGPRHEATFGGRNGFKVSLPGNLLWHRNANGSYRIDDTANHNIVPHVYGDRQGNLDEDSKKLLLQDPYEHLELKQKTYDYHTPGTDFNQHYETMILNQ